MNIKTLQIILLAFHLLFIHSICKGQTSKDIKYTVSINPAGVFFFGPSLNFSYVINPNTTVDAGIRRNSWGLLARKIRSDQTLYEFKGLGYALGATKYAKSIEEGIYYGGIFSIDIQNTKYIKDSPWAWHEKTRTFALLAKAGKRFKIGSQYFVNVGGTLGAGLTKYHWEYDDKLVGIMDEEPRKGSNIWPVGSIELSFGLFL